MKTLSRSLFVLFFSAAALTFAATGPSLQVQVSSSAGKVVFKGNTNGQGVFATPDLAPGNYVVQFNAKAMPQDGPFAVVVSAGKKKVVADSVPGSKFTKGGVAVRVEVPKEMKLTGQVAKMGAVAAGSSDSSNGNSKVKYINGKKYVWLEHELGSNLGGRWVAADSAEGRQAHSVSREDVNDMQTRARTVVPPGSGGGSGN